MTVKLLTEHDLEFLSLTGGCTDSYESKLVQMPHCWKSHVASQRSEDNPYQPFIIAYWHCNIQANLAYLNHINIPMNSATQPNTI